MSTSDNAHSQKIAVIGSGMAGLVTAWLLRQDPKKRYEVEVFENGSEPSLDIASISVENRQNGQVERVDVPMRAFTEGYYHNLKAMYDYLNVSYCVQPFLFSFSRISVDNTRVDGPGEEKQYFVHASNNHRLPPIRPMNVGLFAYLSEVIFAFVCHLWFSLCCLLVPTKESYGNKPCESFEEYLRRIMLPPYFIRYYLLPLMSAVTTCSHKSLLKFPAADVVGYKRSITSGRQLTVSAGVNEVQRKLTKGVRVHCSAQVVSVEPQTNGVRIQWHQSGSDGTQNSNQRTFSKVVLAVPPNVVGSIFEPLRKDMRCFPTIPVETIVHHDTTNIDALNRSIKFGLTKSWFSAADADRAHIIQLRTLGHGNACTEATHVQSSGVMVTSCPLAKREPSRVLSQSTFTRVLRTPESRYRVNKIFASLDQTSNLPAEKQWKNGDGGVYLVGSWCWDGMVLLEGCVVSAMRTASALGVEIPWCDRP